MKSTSPDPAEATDSDAVAGQETPTAVSQEAAAAAPQAPGLALPARHIPVPTTISAAAQAVLAQPGLASAPEPDPADKAGWETHILAGNAVVTQMLAQQVESRKPAKPTEHQLSHATLFEIEPTTLSAENSNNALFFIHGGGFTRSGARASPQI
jgi:hypothetical protein